MDDRTSAGDWDADGRHKLDTFHLLQFSFISSIVSLGFGLRLLVNSVSFLNMFQLKYM